jgi:hypothetical protein
MPLVQSHTLQSPLPFPCIAFPFPPFSSFPFTSHHLELVLFLFSLQCAMTFPYSSIFFSFFHIDVNKKEPTEQALLF